MKLKTQERASLEMVLLSCQGRQVSIKEMSLLWEQLLVALCGDLLTRQNQTGRQERREKWKQSKLEKMTEEKPTKAAKRSRGETEAGNRAVAVVQLLSHVQLFVAPWTAAHQASLSFTISPNLLNLMSIESVMSSSHLVPCCPLLLLPSVFPCIRVFSNESALCIRWPKVLELQLQHQSFQ